MRPLFRIFFFSLCLGSAGMARGTESLFQRDGAGRPQGWEKTLRRVVTWKDSVQANDLATRAHYELSQGLSKLLGPGAGANFHTWAVWGSYKAGVTIREEDIPRWRSYVRGTRCAGLKGLLFPDCTFHSFAKQKIKKTTDLISQGNRLVLGDIGKVTARFISTFLHKKFESALEEQNAFREFLGSFHFSSLEDGSPHPLVTAFTAYWNAMHTESLKLKHEYMLLGNLSALLWEHRLLQPYIEGSIAYGFRIYASEVLLKYQVGDEELVVGDDVPEYEPNHSIYPWSLQRLGVPELITFYDRWDRSYLTLGSRAEDWTVYEQRISYVCSLFRTRHLKPELFNAPSRMNARWARVQPLFLRAL